MASLFVFPILKIYNFLSVKKKHPSQTNGQCLYPWFHQIKLKFNLSFSYNGITDAFLYDTKP